MKRIAAALVLVLLLPSTGTLAEWSFVKPFPDANFKWPVGSQGITTDPDGKVWIQFYNSTDSIYDGAMWRPVRQIFVFNPAGSSAPFSGFKTVTIGATTDTLYNSSRGMRTAADGHILFSSGSKMYKVNHKTGAGIAVVQPPAGQTLTAPAVDGAGNVYVGCVVPGYPIWKYDASLNLLGTVTDGMPDYSRAFEISADGATIYWAGYMLSKVLVYKKDTGLPEHYTLKDSVARGMAVESFAWNPKTGYLYMSAGSETNPPLNGWSKFTWYAYNTSANTVVDSINWNILVAPGDPRPRGIAFSPGGDTAYVAAYNTADPCVQMFRSVPVTAESEPNNAAGAANTIAYGALVDGTISPAGDIDYFRFQVTAGDTMVITTEPRNGSLLHGKLWLYKSDGNLLAASDNYFQDTSRAKIIYIASSTEFHYIRYAYWNTAGSYPNRAGTGASGDDGPESRVSVHAPATILAETGEYRLVLSKWAPSLPTALMPNPLDIYWNQTGFSSQVNTGGLPTTVVFEYGQSTSYGSEIPAAGNPLNNLFEINAQVFHATGFDGATGYHVRTRVTNAFGTTYSPDNFFVTPAYPDGWELQPSGTQTTLRSVSFAGTTAATAVGNNGQIIRTTDGGTTWFNQVSGTTAHLRGVTFTDANHGSASGQSGTILRTTDGGTTWTPQTSGTTKHLYVMAFTDLNSGWVVGEGGTILHTTNGGASWNPQSSGTTVWLWGVDFSNANNGTAVGEGGTILRTTNGGATWVPQTSGTAVVLYSVCFLDANNGTVAGDQETILRTTNGGTTWQRLSGDGGNYFLTVAFTDLNNGTAVGTRMARTTDGGTTWNRVSTGTYNMLYGVSFSGAGAGIAAGSYGAILRTRGAQIYPETEINNTAWQANPIMYGDSIDAAIDPEGDLDYFMFTGNFGDKLEIFARNMPGASVLDGMLWLYDGGGNLMASNDDFAGDNTRSKIMCELPYDGKYYVRYAHFTNTGSFPNRAKNPAAGISEQTEGVNGLAAASPKTAAILATTGNYRIGVGRQHAAAPVIQGIVVMGCFWNAAMLGGGVDPGGLSTTVAFQYGLTTAYGSSVAALESPITGIFPQSVNSPAVTGLVPGSTYHFRIAAANAMGTVYSSDMVFKTAAPPEGWVLQSSGTTTTALRGVSFADANTGNVTGANGTILRTTDGGSNWSTQTSGTVQTLRGVSLLNASTGIAVGTAGTILRTTNGGTNWVPQVSGTTGFLRAVQFANANDGIAAGDIGTIVRTTNGGTTWGVQTSSSTVALFGVSIVDAGVAMAVGETGTILRTTDGGATWPAQTSGTGLNLFGVSFVDASRGWVVGQGGTLLRTTDGGATWASQTSGTTVNLFGVAFADPNNGVAVGDTGVILRTGNGGTTWVRESSGTTSCLVGVTYVAPFTWCTVGNYGVILRSGEKSSWQASLTVSDACGGSGTISYGLAPGATDALNVSLGEAELPPPPPTGVFDACFALPVSPSIPSFKDYRSDTSGAATWRMRFQPGLCGYPVTFTWDSSALPVGSFTLKDEFTGTLVNVDMRKTGRYTLTNSGIASLLIDYTQEICRDVTVRSGWNILSVPTTPNDSSVATLFPGATTQAYSYNNAYVAATHLRPGRGYWLKFAAGNTFAVCGKPVRPLNVQVSAGWNIIGGFDEPVTTAAITTTPAGIIGSNFYGYESGYHVPATLETGKGYWVRATQAGVLNLWSPMTKAEGVIAAVDPAWVRVMVRDAAGSEGFLYLASGDLKNRKPDLPPVPPEGIFDVRFAGDRYVESGGTQHEVVLSSAKYPLLIQATNLQGAKLTITDGEDGVLVKGGLEEGKVATIAGAVRGLKIGVGENLPATFDLSQNFPNPFNPATMIRYQLPVASSVRLVVYDLLGREVAELVNAEQEAGYYEVQFRADQLASGVYLYRMEAGPYTAVKKVVVMK